MVLPATRCCRPRWPPASSAPAPHDGEALALDERFAPPVLLRGPYARRLRRCRRSGRRRSMDSIWSRSARSRQGALGARSALSAVMQARRARRGLDLNLR